MAVEVEVEVEVAVEVALGLPEGWAILPPAEAPLGVEPCHPGQDLQMAARRCPTLDPGTLVVGGSAGQPPVLELVGLGRQEPPRCPDPALTSP